MTSPPKPDSKYDDLVMSTSIPELKSKLGDTNKFKPSDLGDGPTRFRTGDEEQNFTITEKAEEHQDKTSSLQEVSPLTPDTFRSLTINSPQRPP